MGSSARPCSRRVWLMYSTIFRRMSILMDKSEPLSRTASVAAVAADPTVSVRLPVPPVPFLTLMVAVPGALATATQKVRTFSTATVSGALELAVYSAPLGPMMSPLRSPTTKVLPLQLDTRISGPAAWAGPASRDAARMPDTNIRNTLFFLFIAVTSVFLILLVPFVSATLP